MKKLVCESLNSFFKLNENLEEIKMKFSELGYDENSEQWKSFVENFGSNPELMEKIAEKILKQEEPIESLDEILAYTIEAKGLGFKIEDQTFISLSEFRQRLYRFIRQQEQNNLIKKAEIEREEIDKAIKNDDIIIKKLNLKLLYSGQKGLYCISDVYNSEDKNKKGEGLYIWTDLPLLYNWNGNPKDLKIKFKFGQFGAFAKKEIAEEIGKTAGETIKSYSGTYLSPKVVLYIKNLNDYFQKENSPYKNSYEIEHQIAEALKKKGWNTSLQSKSTEVYQGGTLQELLETINKVLSGTTKAQLIPRKEQNEGINKISNFFSESQNREFLLSAKMRYGKNITVLNAIKNLAEVSPEFKNCLVITYKPSVFSSLKDDIEKYSNFKDFQFVDIRKAKNIPKESDKIRIFISSAQYALYGSKDDVNESEKNDTYKLDIDTEVNQVQEKVFKDYNKNIDKIKNIHFGLIMADEYHYGTKSANFRNLLNQLSFDKIIYVSGTAMKDMATGKFGEDQTYNWTYIDEQKAKEEEKKLKLQNPDEYYPHLDMPTMVFYKMQLSNEALNLANDRGLYSADQGFSFTKLIDVDSEGKLVNEQLMRVLLKQIIDPKYGNMSITGSNAKGNLDHTFWVLAKNVKGIKATANLMREMKEFSNYDIIEATGNLNNDIDKVKNKISSAENNGRGSITLTCYRFKEGTTVPEWHGVVMLDDGKSAEEYLQAIFRSQSPGRHGDEKDYCYVFDFNPERLLSIYHDIAQWNSKTGRESQNELVKEFLRYAPILQDDGNKMVPVDEKQIIENFRLHGSFSEKMANDRVFNEEYIEGVLDEDLMTYLSGVSSKKNATEIRINTHRLEKSKNSISRREFSHDLVGVEEFEVDLDVETQKEKIRNVLRRIPTFLFASEFAERGIEDIINTDEPELFEEICGTNPDFLQKLLDKKIISARVINETIGYFHDVIDQIETEPTLEAAESFFKKHLVMHGEESSTPASIVNEMLDKLPEEIWRDKNKTFLDPVCGTGKFLIGIYERLMKGLEEEIADEEERSKWIIENMIHGYDNVKHKVIMALKLLGNKPYKYNIDVEDTLNKDWENMSFDVIVGNPPYKGGMHLDFLEMSYNLSKRWIIFVHPSSWLLDEKGLNKKYKEIKNLIKKNIRELIIFYGNKIFSVGLFYPFVINIIDKDYENDNKIKVIDKIHNTENIYDNIDDINIWGNKEIYIPLKNKILSLCKKNNVLKHKNKNEGKYYVNISRIRAGVHNEETGKWKPGFYATTPLNYSPEKNPNPDKISIGFDSISEANNFLSFIHSIWGMFALSIYKNNQNINRGELGSVPWLDWSRPWTEADFEALIDATPEEIEFVHKNIPNYYDI